MFQTLTHNLTRIFDKIKGNGTLSESNMDSALRDIRIALLEADVALPVVKDFIAAVREKAVGQQVIRSVSPGQMVVKIIHDEMINILSSSAENTSLQLQSAPPVNIMMVGLQGSGKTTASAKLALRLKNQNKKVLLTSLDTYRPAAQEQLARLASSINVDSLPIITDSNPIAITKRSITESKLSGYDIVIYDTAGRLHIDDDMLEEVAQIKNLVMPTEILLVIDAMIGQDAVHVANNFNNKLAITGVILSRIDGDARGGAALSIKHVTNKPIKFLSNGEHLSNLEEFNPERVVSRILDMGDIVSFVEKAASVIDHQDAERTAAKYKKCKFDLNDYLSQIRSIRKLGGFSSILSMLPGTNQMIPKIASDKLDDKLLLHQEAIILSMTKTERKNPDILNAMRRKRIASGSGTSVQKVNMLLKQFKQISELMKKAGKMDAKQLMRSGIGKLFS